MRTWRAVMLAKVEGSPRHKEASRLYRREAAMVVKLGKLLRLGPRHDRTKLRTVPSIKPWDVTDSAPEKRPKMMPQLNGSSSSAPARIRSRLVSSPSLNVKLSWLRLWPQRQMPYRSA